MTMPPLSNLLLIAACLMFVACGTTTTPREVAAVPETSPSSAENKVVEFPDGPLVRWERMIADPAGLTPSPVVIEALAPLASKVREYEAPIAHTEEEFEFIRRDGPLASWMADVIRSAASDSLGRPVDVGFINAGGVRNTLPKGDLSYISFLEVMPFDNEIAVIELEGWQLDWMAYRFARTRGGFPISGAEIFADENTELTRIVVGGRDIEPRQKYLVATSDFLLSGGDMFGIQGTVPEPIPTGIKIRDALVESSKALEAKGLPVAPPLDGWRYCYDGHRVEYLP